MSREKEFGKLSQQQFRELYAAYHQLKQEKADFTNEATKNKARLEELVTKTGSWGIYYEFSYLEILSMFLIASGLADRIKDACTQEDPQQEVIDLIEGDWLPEDLTEEEEALMLGLHFANIGNISGMKMFSQTVSSMIEQVANGNDEALFKAVFTDRASVQAEPIARRICKAQILGDEPFMNLLAKAITRTKPGRPKLNYDDLRFMLEVMDDACDLDNITHSRLYDLVVDDLELYPDDGKDPISSLKKLIQKRNSMTRK